jgi:hypothetical protein
MAEMPETVATIDFAPGSTYHGLEVRMTLDITLDEALTVGTMTVGQSKEMFDQLGGYLRGWNITRKGKPVPCTAQALSAQPLPFVAALLRGYRDALGQVMSVDDPFASVSNNGSG